MRISDRLFSLVLATLILAAAIGLILFSFGCASRPPLSADSFPDAIAAQCEKAKAQAIRQYGVPPVPFWHVEMKQGERWGSQWAINMNGEMVGGHTMGSYTVIGCGPDGQINYGDLLHEAGEWATWGGMHQ